MADEVIYIDPLSKEEEVETVYIDPVQPAGPRKYTADDLGQFMPQIRDYGKAMVGDAWDNLSDEEVIEQYTNRMRGFAAGNTVRAGRELARLNSLTEDQLALAGGGYKVWNEMEGLFSEEATWSETFEGVKDYGRAMLLDPANLIGMGIGKAFAGGSTKVAVRVAQKQAMKAFQKKIGTGATREAAEAAGNKVFAEAVTQAAKVESKDLLTRAGQRAAVNTSVKKLTTRESFKELGATLAFDVALSVGTELAYQQGMMMTGQQEDLDRFGLGLAALGVVAVGGLSAGSIAMRGSSGLSVIDPFKKDPVAAGKVVNKLKEVIAEGDWAKKVAGGKELGDLDTDFWKVLLLGDEKEGIRGLSSILAEEGYTWQKRSKDDKVSNFIADVLKTADKTDAEDFIKLFEEKTGVKMPELSEEVSEGGMEAFANMFAKKMNQGGVILNATSQVSKALGRKVTPEEISEMTLGDIVSATGVLGPRASSKTTISDDWISKTFEGGLQRFQNNTIRMLVSNLSTTALNVKGWSAATALNSASDILIAGLYGGQAGAKLLTGNVKDAGEAFRIAKNLAANQKDKLLNLMDPATTYDTFRSIVLARPEAMRSLTDVLPGGIEDVNKLLRDRGFNPDMTVVGNGTEAMVSAIQSINLVTAQDVFTKSQEFLSQLDKGLRLDMGTTLRELTANPNALKVMASEPYQRIEAKALYETRRAIFSESYKGKGAIGEIAGAIEDARNIPVIGIMVPFGRFFNNVVATIADTSGLTLATKMVRPKHIPDRSIEEVATRTAITWGLIGSMMQGEKDSRDEGLAWSEYRDPRTGEVIDSRYDFPHSLYKAASRLATYWHDAIDVPEEELAEMGQMVAAYTKIREAILNDKEVPPELVAQMGKDVVGQLTRQLVESSEGVFGLLSNTLNGDASSEDWATLVGTPAAQMASAWTRFLEPLDVAVGMAKGTDFKSMDKKQGNELVNKALGYIANTTELLTGKQFPEQQYSAASGKRGADPTKYVGKRTGGILTSTEKVMNTLGLPTYTLDTIAGDPAADNRFNRLFHSIIEDEASKVWESERFQKGSLELKKSIWSEVVNRANKNTKEYMERAIRGSGDRRLITSFRISNSNYSKALIQNGLDTIANGADLGDLNYEQLLLLESWLKTRESWLKRQ